MSDRAYLGMSLFLSMMGCLIMLNFSDHRRLSSLRTTLGLSIMGMGLCVGARTTANIFAKIIGVPMPNQLTAT